MTALKSEASQGSLEARIDRAFAAGAAVSGDQQALSSFHILLEALEAGTLRAAEPDPASLSGWRVNAWVKRGILLGFRLGSLEGMGSPSSHPAYAKTRFSEDLDSHSELRYPFIDKNTFPTRTWHPRENLRVVPGGSSIRAGAYLAPGVICMPPMYVNTGAYVDSGTMVDSHALVGSCAQIGRRVHLSAAAQIGGVLEPVNASPVIIEDDVLVGGNCGVYEGTVVKRGAVLAAGTILTRGTPVYDIVHSTVIRAGHRDSGSNDTDLPLIIPANAVVVPGSRSLAREKLSGEAADWNLSVYTPVIVKYRDSKTDLSTTLEDLLR